MKHTSSMGKSNRTVMILLILGLSTIIFPLYMTIVIAFKQPSEMTNSISGILSLPKTWSLDNFREAMRVTDFWHSLRNSLLISVSTIVLSVLIHSLMGYALGRNKAHSKFYGFVYLFIVSGMFVPFAILMMPLAKQTAELHLANWVGVIILYVVFYMPMNIMLYSGYLVNIPMAGGRQGGRRFHLEDLLEDHLSHYGAHARNGSRNYGTGRMERCDDAPDHYGGLRGKYIAPGSAEFPVPVRHKL